MNYQIRSIKENMNQRSPNKIGMILVLSIDDHQKANVVTDVYILTNDSVKKCDDVCVMILKDPVKINNEIVPGIKLVDLNVILSLTNVSQIKSYHIETSAELNKQSIMVGYWFMDIDNRDLRFNLHDEIEQCVLGCNRL
jgi:hypothetical protein